MDALNASVIFEVRSFTRSWDNRGYSKNLGSFWIRPCSFFSQIFKGLLFGWTLWIYLPNLKFLALPVPEIIGGTTKIWAVPGYAHAPLSPKFLKGFCSDGVPVNMPAKFEVRSFMHSWDNRGYSTKLGCLWIRSRSLFSKIFHGLVFGWTLWIQLPNLKSVALAIAVLEWGCEPPI